MIKFLKFLTFLLLLLTALFLLLSTTLKFLLLNPAFYKKSFSKDNSYSTIAKAAKETLKQSILDKIGQSYPDLSKLPAGTMQSITGQIDEVLSPIDAGNTKDFLDTNLDSVLGYLNGNTNKFIIYVPVNKLGLTDALSPEIKDQLKDDKLDILKLTEKQELKNDKQKLVTLGNTGKNLNKIIFFSSVTFMVLLTLFLLLNRKNILHSISKFLIFTGIITLILTFLINSVKVESSPTFGTSPASLLTMTILSPLIVEIVKYWLIFSIALMVVGVIFYLLPKHPATIKEKTIPQSTNTRSK